MVLGLDGDHAALGPDGVARAAGALAAGVLVRDVVGDVGQGPVAVRAVRGGWAWPRCSRRPSGRTGGVRRRSPPGTQCQTLPSWLDASAIRVVSSREPFQIVGNIRCWSGAPGIVV